MEPNSDSPLLRILDEIAQERLRQDEKWGEQNHPDYTLTSVMRWPGEAVPDYYKRVYETKKKEGTVSWNDIMLEEVMEMRDEAIEDRTALLREELIQVAAVAVAWIDHIDRRKA